MNEAQELIGGLLANEPWVSAIPPFALGLFTSGLGWFFDRRHQKKQFAHELEMQREQLRRSDAPSKIEIIEKFIRALKTAYKDLEQYKYAIDAIQANGQHTRNYALKDDQINSRKFENFRVEAIDRHLEVARLIRQHIEDLDELQLSITGVAPEYRSDAREAIDQYKTQYDTLYLLPEGQSALKYYNLDERKWSNILASIKGEH